MDLRIKQVEVEGEKVHLKKSKLFGWGVVHPIKENGKINWKNLIAGGSWVKLGFMAFIMVFILMAIHEYVSIVNVAQECFNNWNLTRLVP